MLGYVNSELALWPKSNIDFMFESRTHGALDVRTPKSNRWNFLGAICHLDLVSEDSGKGASRSRPLVWRYDDCQDGSGAVCTGARAATHSFGATAV